MDMTTVSEILAMKILNAAQACELFQLKAAAELQRLTGVRNTLVEQARTEVQAPVDYVYNTETRTFQSKTGPQPLSASRKRQSKRLQQGAA